MSSEALHARARFSLRRKAFLSLSLLMLLVMGMIGWHYHSLLVDYRASERHEAGEQAAVTLAGVLKERARLLVQLAALYREQQDLRSWQSLLLDEDLLLAGVLDERNQWTVTSLLPPEMNKKWRHWLAAQPLDAQGHWQLVCGKSRCELAIFRTLLDADGHRVRAMLVQGLGGVLESFQKLSELDLALVHGPESPRLVVATHRKTLVPLVARHGLQAGRVTEGWMMLPVETTIRGPSAFSWWAFEDRREEDRLFQVRKWQAIGLLVGLWLLFEGLLWQWLKRPMGQLEAVAGAAECLSERRFDAARQLLASIPCSRWPDELDRLVAGFREMTRRMAQLYSRLEKKAYQDALTHLPNRNALQGALRRWQRAQKKGAFILVDIDHFQSMNALYGHERGDALLKGFAQRLRALLPDGVKGYRLDSDRFILLWPAFDCDRSGEVLRQLIQELEAPYLLEGDIRLSLKVNLGIVLLPRPAMGLSDLVLEVEQVRKQMRYSGEPSMLSCPDPNSSEIIERVRRQQAIYDRLHQALKDDLFELVFQPIAATDNPAGISHYEVLLRLQDEAGEPISPGEFIPLAERMGLIHQIDRWVLRRSIAQLARCLRQGRQVRLGVNLSALTVRMNTIADEIITLLEAHVVPAECLLLEVTETAYLDTLDTADAVLGRLHGHGVAIALDDFGVGYASFNYLTHLPLSYVKLDGYYVRQLKESARARAFVKGVAAIARGYGMKVIAEFVEDGELLTALRELGIDYAQGYYIGRPAPMPDKACTMANTEAE